MREEAVIVSSEEEAKINTIDEAINRLENNDFPDGILWMLKIKS